MPLDSDGLVSALLQHFLSVKSPASATIILQALADSGTVAVTFSATGLLPKTIAVEPCPSAFRFDRTAPDITRGSTLYFYVSVTAIVPPSVSAAANRCKPTLR